MGMRSDELHAAVDAMIGVHERWVADENRPSPDTSYWEGVDELIETFDNGDIPSECRKLSVAVEQFADQVDLFHDRDDVEQMYPDSPYWESWENVAQARELPAENATTDELPPLEPIPILHAQNVQHDQIARMYGLFLPNGEPARHLVQRELDKPGSVINANWKDPRQKAAKENKSLQETAKIAREDRQKQKTENAGKACPESPRDLWEQDVDVEQAARMLKMPLAEVTEMFAEFDSDAEGSSDDSDDSEAEQVERHAKKKPATTKAQKPVKSTKKVAKKKAGRKTAKSK